MLYKRRNYMPLAALALLFALAGCGASIKAEYDRSLPNDPSKYAEQTIHYVNQERRLRGLHELTIVPELMQASQFHSDYMVEKDCFEHECRNGPTVPQRYEQFNYKVNFYAENIAAGQATPWEAFVSWMNSPGHRANILNENPTTVGAGYRFEPRDGGRVRWAHYWTMNFGRPKLAEGDQPVDAMRVATEFPPQ